MEGSRSDFSDLLANKVSRIHFGALCFIFHVSYVIDFVAFVSSCLLCLSLVLIIFGLCEPGLNNENPKTPCGFQDTFVRMS